MRHFSSLDSRFLSSKIVMVFKIVIFTGGVIQIGQKKNSKEKFWAPDRFCSDSKQKKKQI